MVKEKAYAKINLFLNVLSKRVDNYHDLEMVMASLELHDILTFEQNANNDIIINSDKHITTNQEENLVYKIAKHIQTQYNIPFGVTININKNIPIAAGLAGGSADAAATLRGLNKLWKLKLTLGELAEIGLEFGSDIPFCIYNKLCVARGRGEDLMFLDKKLKMPILLVNPNVEISTQKIFQAYDTANNETKKVSYMTNAIYNQNFDLIAKELYNALEEPAFKECEEIKTLKEHILNTGADGALMSGSGASVFAFIKSKQKMKYIYDTIRDDYYKIITKLR